MRDWIIDFVEVVVQDLGYLGIAGLMWATYIFPPLPTELVMPFVGYAASENEVSFWGAIVAGTVGSVLGTLPWYLVSRMVGQEKFRSWVERQGAWLALSGEEVTKVEQWFERHGHVAVFLGRLVPGIRELISVPAGLSAMPFVQFLAYSVLGIGLWTTVLGLAGYLVETQAAWVHDYLGPVAWVVVIAIVIWYIVRVVRIKRGSRAES